MISEKPGPIPAPAVDLISIPAGSFQMGSQTGSSSEAPIHSVSLDAFRIDSTPVTNAAFAEFTSATGYQTTAEQQGHSWGYDEAAGKFGDLPQVSWKDYATPNRQEHPVVSVSWEDAMAFAAWAGKSLPTEAQWELAARGGLVDQLYPWGNEDPGNEQCNFANAPSFLPPTTPVRAFPPNALGLYDMVGNVWQWCLDSFDAEFYAHSPSANPVCQTKSDHKVRRGGSWNVIQAFRLRNANRGAAHLRTCVPNIGFRCVVNL